MIKNISVGVLEDQEAWIFMPKSVEYFASKDGIKYEPLGKVENKEPSLNKQKRIKDISKNVSKIKTRYIKVKIENIKKCPNWHMGEGGKAWLFVDEIIIKE